MRQVKTKAKAYELAEAGKLFFINENFGYTQANIGLVISSFEVMKFYYKP